MGKEDSIKKATLAMDEERKHLGNLLYTRLNFYIVFASLFLVSLSEKESFIYHYRIEALSVVIIISVLFAFSVTRTHLLVECALKNILADSNHPYSIISDEVSKSWCGIFKKRPNNYLHFVPWLAAGLFAYLLMSS